MSSARMIGDVGFNDDVTGLIPAADRDCMDNAVGIDLHDWQTMRRLSQSVLDRVSSTDDAFRMPPPPAPRWSDANVGIFRHWMEEGTPARKGEFYASFFRDLDSYTEYFDAYGRPATENYMPRIMQYFGSGKALNKWQALASTDPSQSDIIKLRRKAFEDTLQVAVVRDAIRDVDDLLRMLVSKFFALADSTISHAALVDGFEQFGRDRLPLDVDREQRIRNANPNDPRLPHAHFHRMDGAVMWFNWAGHYECAMLVDPDPKKDEIRRAALAATLAGSAFDYVFRKRQRSRPEFYQPDGERIIRDRYVTLAQQDKQGVLDEAYLLFRIAFA